MPCRDYYDEQPNAYYASTIEGLKKQVSFAESALCQTLAALERVVKATGYGNFYDLIDYKAAGIKRKELTTWHTRHKALDDFHRAEEKAKREREAEKAKRDKEEMELRKSAIKKLNSAERKALGIE